MEIQQHEQFARIFFPETHQWHLVQGSSVPTAPNRVDSHPPSSHLKLWNRNQPLMQMDKKFCCQQSTPHWWILLTSMSTLLSQMILGTIQFGLWIGIMPLGFHLHGINHIALSLHMLDVGAFCLLVKASKDAGKVHDVPAKRVFFIKLEADHSLRSKPIHPHLYLPGWCVR